MKANDAKEYYRAALDAALQEIKQNGFDFIWNDNVAEASITITFEAGMLVYVTYQKKARTKPLRIVPDIDDNDRTQYKDHYFSK